MSGYNGANVSIDVSDMVAFFDKMKSAKGDFKKELETWLDAMGQEFLEEVQNQIISRNAMNSRLLLHSFEKGDSNNFWSIDLGALCLEVGSTLDYAIWVNNGHHQKPGRFIPGHWEGNEFVYTPGEKSGMVLKAEWVKGKLYFDVALKLFAPVWEKSFEKNFENWITNYFTV